MYRMIFWVLITGLFIIVGCQIAGKLAGQGLKNKITESIDARASGVIGQITEALESPDTNRLNKTLEVIRELIQLYQQNRVNVNELSVIRWLLVVLCCLEIIRIVIYFGFRN